MPINFLTGRNSLRRLRNKAHTFADEMYGGQAASMQPIKELGATRATEGLGEAQRSSMREGATGQVFRPSSSRFMGGQAGTAIASSTARDIAGGQAMAGIERDIITQDQGVRREGETVLANTEAQQGQMRATRDAAKTQADMQYEAELSARKQQLGATLLNVGLTVAGGKLGKALGKKVSGLFGTEEAPEVAGAADGVVGGGDVADVGGTSAFGADLPTVEPIDLSGGEALGGYDIPASDLPEGDATQFGEIAAPASEPDDFMNTITPTDTGGVTIPFRRGVDPMSGPVTPEGLQDVNREANVGRENPDSFLTKGLKLSTNFMPGVTIESEFGKDLVTSFTRNLVERNNRLRQSNKQNTPQTLEEARAYNQFLETNPDVSFSDFITQFRQR